MQKLFLFMMVSVDGFFEGENHDLSWHHVDAEFNEFAIDQLEKTDTLLFGKTTYELMASYWPTEGAVKDDTQVANLMNKKQKFVFSKTLEKADWEQTTLIHKGAEETIKKLMKTAKGDIGIFGSNNFSVSLMEKGLIDEFRLIVNPVILGKGTHLFEGFKEQLSLHLTRQQEFRSGNVLLCYQNKKQIA